MWNTPPMATGDTLAGGASAAKTPGIREYDPVPGWQMIYFRRNPALMAARASRSSAGYSPPPGYDARWGGIGSLRISQ